VIGPVLQGAEAPLAERAVGKVTIPDAGPRPMTFDGRLPLRNDVIQGDVEKAQSP